VSTSAKMVSARATCDFTITELLFGLIPRSGAPA
jgi:hypothetical protein